VRIEVHPDEKAERSRVCDVVLSVYVFRVRLDLVLIPAHPVAPEQRGSPRSWRRNNECSHLSGGGIRPADD